MPSISWLLFYLGGDVPKNFIQQTEAMMGDCPGGHSFAIQYTTDAPHCSRGFRPDHILFL